MTAINYGCLAEAESCERSGRGVNAMDLQDAIAGRRSVRDYTEAAIDETTIHRLIGAAVLAPTAMNEQPWTFTIVRNRTLLSDISRRAKAHLLSSIAKDEQGGHFAALHDESFHIFTMRRC